MKRILIVITLAVFLIGGLLVWRQKNDESGAIFQQTLKVFKPDSEKQPVSSNPLAIENLRKRAYEGSQVTIEDTLSRNASYTAYRVSYLSDGLKIFAAMNVPTGSSELAEGFPVIVLNHGYFNQLTFKTGDGTRTMADILAKSGYLTLASDYRCHGGSDCDGVSRGHRAEYSADVMNLLSSVRNIKQADAQRIGVWGHSMGGEVALKVLEINEQVKAAVLWAPTIDSAGRSGSRWGRRRATESTDSQSFKEASSMNYLSYITAPIQLHHGTADSEVPYEWSVELDEKLKEAGKNVEFFTYEGQDHNFKNLGWGKISPRTVEFFDKNVKAL
ncbi:alpha/beta fold hydrolase [Patescibacteria group bacterium]|nr:alpha/beta fold hydrolase [Patescibacteria group bacterium]